MKNSIKITHKSFKHSLAIDDGSKFRSVEKQLEGLSREFEVTDCSQTITVAVQDESDAIRLSNVLRLESVDYCEDGVCRKIPIILEKKSGRLKNSVYVKSIGKSMTMKRFSKYSLAELQKTHLTKTQIIKAKLLTKGVLEKGLDSGVLTTVAHGGKLYVDREKVFKLMG